MSDQRTKVLLADEPPRFVNGMAVSVAQTPNAKVFAISFFTSYGDPRDEEPDTVIRQHLAPIMMHRDAAKALIKMLTRATEERLAEEDEGDSS